MGQLFASYTYKLSTMSTASNVVLGAMGERINFIPYFIYLTVMAIVFAIPSYWVMSPRGFLHKVGTVDIAGCSFIHLAGSIVLPWDTVCVSLVDHRHLLLISTFLGTAGLMATIMLKPRAGRFDYPLESFELSDPTNALLGTYMLWYDSHLREHWPVYSSNR